MGQVLDYSSGRPSAAAVKAAGYLGAVRYISRAGNQKDLTTAEAQDYWAHGLALAVVYELGQDPLNEDPASVGAIVNGAMKADGFPDGWPFYIAFDKDEPPERWAQIAGWGDACSRAAGRPWRGYCESALGERLATDGHFPWFWDPYAWSGEYGQQGGKPSAHACLFQRLQTVVVDGIDCDVSDIIQQDWAGYCPNAQPPPPPQPIPPPVTTNYRGDSDVSKRIDLTIATDKDGNGYGDIGEMAEHVINVMVNGADPAHAGYGHWEGIGVEEVATGVCRVQLSGGPPSGQVLARVWVTTGQ